VYLCCFSIEHLAVGIVPVQGCPRKQGEPSLSRIGVRPLHAGAVAQAHERDKLERLCRHITRPAIAEKRLSISPKGLVRSKQGSESVFSTDPFESTQGNRRSLEAR
jgi:hypothetical protein